MSLHSTLRSARLVVLSKWLIDFMKTKPALHCIHTDFIPLLIQAQSSDKLSKREGLDKCKTPHPISSSTSHPIPSHPIPTHHEFFLVASSIECLAWTIDKDTMKSLGGSVYCHRVSTPSVYLDVNKSLVKHADVPLISGSAVITSRNQVSFYFPTFQSY
jgi:hypothetical protein